MDLQLESVDRKADLQKAQIQMRQLMHDMDASELDVTRQIDQVAQLKADIQKTRFLHHREVKTILTVEQLAKLKELRQARFDDFEIEIFEDDDMDSDDRREIRKKIIRRGGGY